MSDFQIQPYTGASLIAQGYQSAANSINQAREMQMRAQIAQQQQAMEQKRVDLGYYTNDQTNARDYYGYDLKAQEMADNVAARREWAAARTQEKADETKDKYDPNRYQAVPINGADGNPLPNMFVMPMTGQVLDMNKQPTTPPPAMGADPTGTGNFFYDGKSLHQIAQPTHLPTTAAAAIDAHLSTISQNQQEMATNTAQIAAHQAALAKGDTWTGLFSDRQKQIDVLNAKNKALAMQNGLAQDDISNIKTTYRGTQPAAPGAAGTPPPNGIPNLPGNPTPPVQAPAPAGPPPLVPPLPQGPGQGGAPGTPNPLWPSAPPTAAGIANPPTSLTPDPGAGAAAGAPKPLDPGTAQQILQQAGGDKNKARAMARQMGYTF